MCPSEELAIKWGPEVYAALQRDGIVVSGAWRAGILSCINLEQPVPSPATNSNEAAILEKGMECENQ